jgi:hypothetical protein
LRVLKSSGLWQSKALVADRVGSAQRPQLGARLPIPAISASRTLFRNPTGNEIVVATIQCADNHPMALVQLSQGFAASLFGVAVLGAQSRRDVFGNLRSDLDPFDDFAEELRQPFLADVLVMGLASARRGPCPRLCDHPTARGRQHRASLSGPRRRWRSSRDQAMRLRLHGHHHRSGHRIEQSPTEGNGQGVGGACSAHP